MSKHLAESVPTKVALADLVVVEGFNPRGEIARKGADFEGLRDSIRRLGILQPILVGLPDASGKHPIIDGHRRYAAATELRLKELPALIRQISDLRGASAVEAFMSSFVANVNRDDMPPLQEALAIARARNDFGMKQSEVARACGKTSRWVRSREDLLILPPSIQRAIDKGEIPITAGRHLAPIAKFNPKAAEQIVEATRGAGVVHGPEALVSRWVVGELLAELAWDHLTGLLALSPLSQRRYLPRDLPISKANRTRLARRYGADIGISFDETDAIGAKKRRALLKYEFTPPGSSQKVQSEYIVGEELIVELAEKKLAAERDGKPEPAQGARRASSRPKPDSRPRTAAEPSPSDEMGDRLGPTLIRVALTKAEIEDGLARRQSKDGRAFSRKLKAALQEL